MIATNEETDRASDVQLVRLLVRMREDFQRLRISTSNRLGIKADGGEMNISERPLRADDLDMLNGIGQAANEQEVACEKHLLKVLKRFPVYTEYLANVKGVGTIAAGHILGNINIEIATTVSKIWQYCGMNPGQVRGKKRIAASKYKPAMGQIVREIESHDGKKDYIVQTDEMIRGDVATPGFVLPFNKPLRTALVGVLGDGMIKQGVRGEECTMEEYDSLPDAMRRMKGKQPQRVYAITPQAKVYLERKAQKEQSEKVTEERKKGGKVEHICWQDTSPGHRHRDAIRYMIKMFLAELYNEWRAIEGLEVRPSYHEEKLGHVHSV
jgi:hypothetical protein